MYELHSVTHVYARRGHHVTALDQCSLEIHPGDFVAIVGPSGSGKTTLLSVLGGMLAPSSGRVLFDGRSLYDLNVEQRASLRGEKIGFVFQSFDLISWLSARENVQVPLLLAGRSSEYQCRRAIELLKRVGLADWSGHRPSEMSRGQQQRVALARTLANEPQVILADEPTGNLDTETRQLVMACLKEFHQDGRTIVMVTHDEVAAAFAGRRIRLASGVLQELSLRNAA